MAHDVLVAGGGSAGFAVALAAARGGLTVLLVEPHDRLGGTSTVAGVSAWESGCGGTGFPFELYQRLQRRPGAVGIYGVGRHCCWPDAGAYPGGENVLRPERRYVDTLVRYARGPLSYARPEDRELIRQRFNGVVFEPDAMAATMAQMLAETGRVEVRLGTAVTRATVAAGRLSHVELTTGPAVTARWAVDATGDAALCGACGCPRLSGEDPRARFGEGAAPEQPSGRVNGVTLIFRVAPTAVTGIEALPDGVPATCWWAADFGVAHVVPFPNGDLSVNMLPALEGAEFLALGPTAAYAECRRRLRAFWQHWQRRFPEWQSYRIVAEAAALGVRETQRTVCAYMLRQTDLEGGLATQSHPDIIAIADHGFDVHGRHAGTSAGVHSPYGIPYRCLLPSGVCNLLVAGRAAGFSALAASSCRLARTMMQLGQAAGTACVLASRAGLELAAVPAAELRAELRRQGVTLAWPMEPDLAAYIQDADSQASQGRHGC
jgi:2-polyprenyl-6-methoxyphenol hydroxylase-like FAD-dependent oxidoreductase